MKQDEDSAHEYRRNMGRRLRLVRLQLGESQTQFAARLKVSLQSMHKYEIGMTGPTAEQLKNLEETGVDACYVTFGYPSFDSSNVREKYFEVLAWIQRECRISSLKIPTSEQRDIAWYAFCRLKETEVSDGQTIADEIKLAMQCALKSAHASE